ncbi:MAG: tyrosine--tRNA ligase [Chloroflexi bacterium]|nr:tyrosine--tRNA ligase [Chloroflexota bacterium]MQC47698.1 tyrosine--tRNA ligase [Chloroflexota bacterium]
MTATGGKRRMAPVDEQMRVLMGGTEFGDPATRTTMERELRARLEEDRPLSVYCGFDPTKVDLHLGHTVPLRKMRQFQDFGHQVTFLVGSFTALIGDPTGRDKTRPMLTPDEIAENAKTYTEQAFAVLDQERTRIAFNGDWLSKLTFADVIRITAQFTVAQFLRRDNFSQRYESGNPIHVSEFLYAMMQAYDADEMSTDVQIGGTDQTFNLMAGRQWQEANGHRPQICLTLPILVGTDGHEKMSKSLGNYIGIAESPNEMFGKAMSVPDAAIVPYFTLVTPLHPSEVDAIRFGLESGALPPMEAKKRLAETIVGIFHGSAEGAVAREYFESTFQRRETPDEMPEHALAGPVALADVLTEAGLAASKGEVRRLVQQGGVQVNGERVDDPAQEVGPGDEIRVGRHRFLRLVTK